MVVSDSVRYSSEETRLMITSKESQLKKKQEEYTDLQQELSQLQTRYNEVIRERNQAMKQQEELKEQEETIEKQIGSLRNRMQEIVQKRNNAMGLLEEKRRDIGSISSIPAGAENYRHYSQEQLKTILNKANKHLLKYDKVNRKAMSQYLLFSEKRNEFKKRHKELEEGLKSIHSLISVGFEVGIRYRHWMNERMKQLFEHSNKLEFTSVKLFRK